MPRMNSGDMFCTPVSPPFCCGELVVYFIVGWESGPVGEERNTYPEDKVKNASCSHR
jgi:hypothetical protein